MSDIKVHKLFMRSNHVLSSILKCPDTFQRYSQLSTDKVNLNKV